VTSRSSENIRRPHPLAAALVERLRGTKARVLEIGAGSGRNTAALRDAGFDVQVIADRDAPTFPVAGQLFDAAISTHAFLHGTPAIVDRMLRATAAGLKAEGPFYCTFASKRDTRYGHGARVDRDTYAPESGDEAGVAHVYFDEAGLRNAIGDEFIVESLTEENVDDVVGSWAHAQLPTGSVHWFLRARRASNSR
jgi:hypothetical protein